jgi:hypothetical protein
MSSFPVAPMSSREKMRLAKAALIEDEERQADGARERRKSRRASEISIDFGDSSPRFSVSSVSPDFS